MANKYLKKQMEEETICIEDHKDNAAIFSIEVNSIVDWTEDGSEQFCLLSVPGI